MNQLIPFNHHRILVIDDNPAIHEDIRKILRPRGSNDSFLTSTKSLLFGDQPTSSAQDSFEIDSAFQGEEGLRMVQEADDAGRPYALAFVDVRMPPGWDGIETITRIWKAHSDLQVVICTAYSDYSWEEMVRQIGRSSSMVVLKKPFDNIEVLQLAHALTEKWKLNRQVRTQLQDLDQLVEQRTAELRDANATLKREIAERLQVEQALVLSEERFSKAFFANPIPLAIQSLQRETFTDANAGFEQLTGYSRDDLIDRRPVDLALWSEPEEGSDLLARMQAGKSVRHAHCRLRTRAGNVRDILLSFELIDLNGEACALLVVQDITEQLMLERQLRHSQKMEAVGQLAAGIAHDFNNMLTVIQGNISLVIADRSAAGPEMPFLEAVLGAVQRSAKLVRQLLTFSHKQPLEVTLVSVTDLFASLAEMLPRMLGEQVAVTVTASSTLPPIALDAGMIEQLLMNLAVNARDAMPRGGQLTIGADLVDITESMLRVNQDAQPGRFLRFSVSDTGCGIPPDVLPRIFEPFFTTKPVGKGTGLGLATAYGIARQHKGWIDVHSEVGIGTRFEVYFPLNDAANPGTVSPFAAESPRAKGDEVILVVEDEDAVRFCVIAILESHGYRVVSANTGVQALAVWEKCGDEVDLLLTDVVMPEGISGLELSKRLLARRPDLPVIFTSGYSREISNSQSPFARGCRFLAKPFQSSQLLQFIRESLDQRTGEPHLTSTPPEDGAGRSQRREAADGERAHAV